MEKRALLAVVLSIIILVLYQHFFLRPLPQTPPPDGGTPKVTAPEKKEDTKADIKPGLILNSTGGKVTAGGEVTVGVEQKVSVDTPLYRAIISSRCGSFNSFELKRYPDREGRPVNLLKNPDGLALCIGDDKGFYPDELNFSIKGSDLVLSKDNPSGTIVLEYLSPGLSIRRTYKFNYNSYLIEVRDELAGLEEYWVTLGGEFGISEPDKSFHTGPVILKDLERIEFKEKDIRDQEIIEGRIKWIALEDKYFFSGIVPSSLSGEVTVPQTKVKLWVSGRPMIALLQRGPVNEYKVYAGPKEHDSLKALGLGLEHIIDFGFFSIVARPLFWILKALYNVTGNYGWAIVLLSILIRIPFTPLIARGQKSMKKLQELQPRLEEIRKKYKDDPKRLQMETMELYKKYRVNPFSGCLPILIQLPVFFALYKVLYIAIELRGAPFILWIKDLSQKDPYYVLPLLMGATMIIQQAITPFAGDPRQKRLMLFISGVFTILFLTFPSGLVLYWLMTNILGIIHQLYINKRLKSA